MNRVQLELPVDQISISLMTLEVVADSLKFVVNASPGEVRTHGCFEGAGSSLQQAFSSRACRAAQAAGLIVRQSWSDRAECVQLVSARVCSQNGTVCDSAAALNSVVLVNIIGKNIGFIAASYTISVDNCTYPAQIVPAQSLSLAASEEKTLIFQVRHR
jgi:hypothetical protein